MCVKTYSESGQPCGFEPCDAFKRMKSQYAATNLSLCEINKERRDDIERLEAENAALRQRLESSQQDHLDTIIERDALRQDRDRLAGIVHESMATLGMTQTAWDGTNIPRGEDDLPRWVRDVSQATYKKGLALEKADALADFLNKKSLGDETIKHLVAYQEARHA